MNPGGAVADRAVGTLQVDRDLRYRGVAVRHPGAALRHLPVDLPNLPVDVCHAPTEVANLPVDLGQCQSEAANLLADLRDVPVGVADRLVELRYRLDSGIRHLQAARRTGMPTFKTAWSGFETLRWPLAGCGRSFQFPAITQAKSGFRLSGRT